MSPRLYVERLLPLDQRGSSSMRLQRAQSTYNVHLTTHGAQSVLVDHVRMNELS